MLPKLPQKSQTGYVAIAVIVFMLMISAFIFPWKFPKPETKECVVGEAPVEPETITNLPAVNEIDLPPEIAEHGGGPDPDLKADYVLIRKRVPADSYALSHVRPIASPQPRPGYLLAYPSSDGGKSVEKATRLDLRLRHEGLIFFINQDPSTIKKVRIPDRTSTIPAGSMIEDTVYEVDVYQDKRRFDDKNLGYTAQELFECGAEASIDSQIVSLPFQDVSPDKTQLQLEWFLLQKQGLWGVHCKPAIYLYPPQKQMVNVKIYPSGFLTYVDPPYDSEKGWTVNAFPGGELFTMNHKPITNNYLYFESKIKDEVIEKPTRGWVIKSESGIKSQGSSWFNPLENHFNQILPKLGLNLQQTKDFVDYWTKALPEAPYYFVGVIDQSNVNQIERLEITPKPDSVNRVRIYFERLDTPKAVQAPELSSILNFKFEISNSRFIVVEWGGMVKLHPDTPFTCSQ